MCSAGISVADMRALFVLVRAPGPLRAPLLKAIAVRAPSPPHTRARARIVFFLGHFGRACAHPLAAVVVALRPAGDGITCVAGYGDGGAREPPLSRLRLLQPWRPRRWACAGAAARVAVRQRLHYLGEPAGESSCGGRTGAGAAERPSAPARRTRRARSLRLTCPPVLSPPAVCARPRGPVAPACVVRSCGCGWSGSLFRRSGRTYSPCSPPSDW
jgi:hypothetical protein